MRTKFWKKFGFSSHPKKRTELKMSSFGTIFRVTTYGESHCRSVGCIVENCPPGTSSKEIKLTSGMLLTEDDIQVQLSRRRPGQSALTTAVISLSPYFPNFSAMRKIEYKYSLEQSSTRLSELQLECSSRTSTNVLTTTLRWIFTPDQVMPIGLTSKNTASKQVVAEAVALPEKPSVFTTFNNTPI
jgi:hypothetical protein